MENKILLYGYQGNETMIDTQYGKILHINWLGKEKERIEKNPIRIAEIVTKINRKNPYSALFVNETEGCNCEICRRKFGGVRT